MPALRTMTDEARRAGAEPRARRRSGAKHHFLRADADPLAVAQYMHALDRVPAHLHAVARSEIFDRGAIAYDSDPRVLARNQRIFDRHLTGRAATDHGIALRQIDLLK